jgi:hypothetical protein
LSGGFEYLVGISRTVLLFEQETEGLPRDCLCVSGQRLAVTFLSVPTSGSRGRLFLVVPRGVCALFDLNKFLRPLVTYPDDTRLSAIAFDSGASVRVFGDLAFARCRSLASLCIPAPVRALGRMCFDKCHSLRCVTLEPGSRMTSIAPGAFGRCSLLEVLDLPPDLEALEIRVLSDCLLPVLHLQNLRRLSLIGQVACESSANLRSVLIPGSVREIGPSAFSSCTALSEVEFELPSSLVSIAPEAFAECTALREFRVVASVRQIGDGCLRHSGVRDISVDEDNAHFETVGGCLVKCEGRAIVYYFGNESDVKIGADIEVVTTHSFLDCNFLRSVTFESGSKLRVIGTRAFGSCTALESVQFGGPCPSLESYCFANCVQLRQVLLESPADHLPEESNAFFGCPITTVGLAGS